MKPSAHLFWLTFWLSLSGLMAGCATAPSRTAQRIEPAHDFEVVETSARRPLTAKEMSELRGTVAHYLDQQGQTDSGDYYLKVYLTPEADGVTPEWVVVRFTRYTDTRVAVAAAYPGYDYPSSYYSYDVYPYGYGSFGRISFQYYDDPFYGRRYYYPRRDWRDRDRDRDHHKPGEHKPGDRPPNGNQPPPSGVVNQQPPRPENPRRRNPDRIAPSGNPQNEISRRARREENGVPQNRPVTATPSRPDNPPRTAEPGRQWRGRNEAGGDVPRSTPSPRVEARAPERAAPERTESVNRTADRQPQTSSQPSQRGSNGRRENEN